MHMWKTIIGVTHNGIDNPPSLPPPLHGHFNTRWHHSCQNLHPYNFSSGRCGPAFKYSVLHTSRSFLCGLGIISLCNGTLGQDYIVLWIAFSSGKGYPCNISHSHEMKGWEFRTWPKDPSPLKYELQSKLDKVSDDVTDEKWLNYNGNYYYCLVVEW